MRRGLRFGVDGEIMGFAGAQIGIVSKKHASLKLQQIMRNDQIQDLHLKQLQYCSFQIRYSYLHGKLI